MKNSPPLAPPYPKSILAFQPEAPLAIPPDFLYRIYRTRPTPEEKLRLSPYQWQFYQSINGIKTILEVTVELNFSEEAARYALMALQEAGLVDEVLCTYKKFSGVTRKEVEAEVQPTYLLADVLRFIFEQAGEETEGKLGIYRVFLQIPPALLEAEGVKTFSLNDTTTTVNNPLLRTAISEAIFKVIGKRYEW